MRRAALGSMCLRRSRPDIGASAQVVVESAAAQRGEAESVRDLR